MKLIFSILFILVCVSLVSAFDKSKWDFEYEAPIDTNLSTTSVNNTEHFDGYTVATLTTYLQGLYDLVFAPIIEPLSLHLNQDNWNNDPNDWITWETSDTITFNESKLATTYYNATQSNAVAGTIDGGTLVDTQHPDGSYDDVTFNFSEEAGSPGLDLRVNFTDVTGFNKGYMRYKTSSLSGEYPVVQLWDYDTDSWEGGYGGASESEEFDTLTGDVLDSSNHIQDGVVQMRLYKGVNGNTQNHYYVDMLAIVDGYATPSGNVNLQAYAKLNDSNQNITANNFYMDGDIYNSGALVFYNNYGAVFDIDSDNNDLNRVFAISSHKAENWLFRVSERGPVTINGTDYGATLLVHGNATISASRTDAFQVQEVGNDISIFQVDTINNETNVAGNITATNQICDTNGCIGDGGISSVNGTNINVLHINASNFGTDSSTTASNTRGGYLTMSNVTDAGANSAYGHSAMFNLQTGVDNSCVGRWCLYNNKIGDFNSCVGEGCGFNTIGNYNLYLGSESGYSITDENYTFMVNTNSAYVKETDYQRALMWGRFYQNKLGSYLQVNAWLNVTKNVSSPIVNALTYVLSPMYKLTSNTYFQWDGEDESIDIYVTGTKRWELSASSLSPFTNGSMSLGSSTKVIDSLFVNSAVVGGSAVCTQETGCTSEGGNPSYGSYQDDEWYDMKSAGYQPDAYSTQLYASGNFVCTKFVMTDSESNLFSSISVERTGGTGTSGGRICVYNDSNNRPASTLYSSDNFDMSSNQAYEQVFGETMTQGVYWTCFGTNGTGGRTLRSYGGGEFSNLGYESSTDRSTRQMLINTSLGAWRGCPPNPEMTYSILKAPRVILQAS